MEKIQASAPDLVGSFGFFSTMGGFVRRAHAPGLCLVWHLRVRWEEEWSLPSHPSVAIGRGFGSCFHSTLALSTLRTKVLLKVVRIPNVD